MLFSALKFESSRPVQWLQTPFVAVSFPGIPSQTKKKGASGAVWCNFRLVEQSEWQSTSSRCFLNLGTLPSPDMKVAGTFIQHPECHTFLCICITLMCSCLQGNYNVYKFCSVEFWQKRLNYIYCMDTTCDAITTFELLGSLVSLNSWFTLRDISQNKITWTTPSGCRVTGYTCTQTALELIPCCDSYWHCGYGVGGINFHTSIV